MKIISHRGNLTYVNKDRENSLEYIDEAVASGFDVEIDLRVLGGKLFLGHDDPQYEVSDKWLLDRSDYLWIHCKNEGAVNLISDKKFDSLKFFYHTSEKYSIISNKIIWYHFSNLDELNSVKHENKIVPYINKEDSVSMPIYNFYGICTDFPLIIKNRIDSK